MGEAAARRPLAPPLRPGARPGRPLRRRPRRPSRSRWPSWARRRLLRRGRPGHLPAPRPGPRRRPGRGPRRGGREGPQGPHGRRRAADREDRGRGPPAAASATSCAAADVAAAGDLPAAAAAYEKAHDRPRAGRPCAAPPDRHLHGDGREGAEPAWTGSGPTTPTPPPGSPAARPRTPPARATRSWPRPSPARSSRATPRASTSGVWQARLLNTLGKPEEAEKALRDLIAKHPEDLGPWMALLYFQVSRKDAGRRRQDRRVDDRQASRTSSAPSSSGARPGASRATATAPTGPSRPPWTAGPTDPRVGRAAAEYFTSHRPAREGRGHLRRRPEAATRPSAGRPAAWP